jgi:hypothetical protein
VDCLETVGTNHKLYGQIQVLIAELLALGSGHKSFQKIEDPAILDELLVLLKSDDPEVQVRVAAATSKLASGNENIKKFLMKDQGASQLEKIMNLLHSEDESEERAIDVYEWAVEALSFLTLQSTVKETLVNDAKTLVALFSLAKRKNAQSLWYGIASAFLNICRYVRLDEVEELKKQIAKFSSGQKVPTNMEIDILEQDPAVTLRCEKLVDKGTVPILLHMAKDEEEANANVREVVSETLCHMAVSTKNRGKIMQAGGLKVCKGICSLKLFWRFYRNTVVEEPFSNFYHTFSKPL